MLLSEIKKFDLPLPTGNVILVPETWANHRCTHGQDGLVLKFETDTANIEIESMELSNDESDDPWWDTLDATKNIGYPAREQGRYGSHPSHDGFDDESKP